MTDQIIDLQEAVMPGPTGYVSPALQQLHDETKTFAAQTKTLQDDVVASLLADAGSKTHAAAFGGHCVWIGDSWSDKGAGVNSQNGYIPRAVAAHYGLTLHNMAVGGCGLVTGNKPFLAQAQEAAGDETFANGDVRLVVVFGGINDRYHNVDDTAINELFGYLVSAWPTARIVCIPMQHAWNANDFGNHWQWLQSYYRNAHPQVAIVPDAWTWDLGHPEDFANTNPGHPNATGVVVMAAKIITALDAGQPSANLAVWKVPAVSSDETTGSGSLTVRIRAGGKISIDGYLSINKSLSSYAVCSMPASLILPEGFNFPPDMIANSSTAIRPCFLKIEPDPSRDPIASYIGRPQRLMAYGMQAGIQYYFRCNYDII